jgi:hypothetical protein
LMCRHYASPGRSDQGELGTARAVRIFETYGHEAMRHRSS